jgi:protease-4
MRRLPLLLVALLLPACAPTSVTFTFGDRDDPLRKTPVIEDKNAGAEIALIDIRGTLVDAARPGLFSPGVSPVDELVSRLKMAEEDDAIKGVVLRINSPGGSVTASDIMYNEVRRFCETTRKPVIASFGEVAASGGYYLALACDEIIAQPTSITASIGVIIPTVNVSDGLRRIGIVARSVKSGANKDLANPLEPIRESQYAVLQGMVDEFYQRFRSLVVSRRPGLDPSRVDDLTDGRVVTGAEAVRVGLADREGDLRDAFTRAKELAKVPSARLVRYHSPDTRPRSPYSPVADGPAPAGTEINLFHLDLDATAFTGTNAYYLWSPVLQ